MKVSSFFEKLFAYQIGLQAIQLHQLSSQPTIIKKKLLKM